MISPVNIAIYAFGGFMLFALAVGFFAAPVRVAKPRHQRPDAILPCNGVSMILRKITMSTFRILVPSKSAVSEVALSRSLDAVRSTIEPGQTPTLSPIAANDNGLAWPLLPFPEGWYVAA